MKREDISLETKHRMAQSLKKFMARKSFEKITVREILEDADVTRPTFYYHFENIYDLMTWMFDTELLALLEKSKDCVTWNEGILLALQYIEENRAVCLCAYNSVGRDMLRRLFSEKAKTSMQRFIDTLLVEIPAQSDDVEFIAEFYTISLVNIMLQWLQQPNGRSPEDLIDQIDMVIHGNVEAALKRSAARNH